MPGLWFIFNFASLLQTHIDENPEKFYQAMKAALFYHTLHRALVRKVGRLNQIDMDDHDLSKSRIVHVALAYSYHWDDTPQDDDLKKLASTAIEAGHTSYEDHHPQYEEHQEGTVDVDKLLIDRLSVHIQKDPVDKEKGWGVNEKKCIPEKYQNMWKALKSKNKHIDLYLEALYQAKKQIKSEIPF